jgi:hypothetical protein
MANPSIIVEEADDPLDAYVDDIDRENFPNEYPEEPEAEAAEEPEEGEPEEEPEEQEPEYLEITYKGKPVKLTADEVLEHASKGFDYTQKTMEIAEQRKAVETQAQMLQQQYQLQQQNLKSYAELMSMDSTLEQYSQVNWDNWIDADPIEAQKGWQKYQMLQNRRNEMAHQVTENQNRLKSEQTANLQRQLADAAEFVQREIKGWGSELANELKTTGITSYGFSDSEMNSIIDPRMVKVLHDAHQWRKLQTSKPQTLKKVSESPKAVKPNSKPVDTQANRGKLMKQLKQAKSSRSREAIADSLLDKYA